MMSSRSAPSKRRAFATALVLWAIALAVIILGSLQMSAWRQAANGRDAVGRIRAHWAARSAVEAVVARLEQEATQTLPLGAKSLMTTLAAESTGELEGATFRTRHEEASGVVSGPADAGAKLNINLMTYDDLMLLPNMTEDVANSIVDYIDGDDDPTGGIGAEAQSYLGLPIPYPPRNAPIRSIQELELVIGVKPEWVRGEDWNLNGVLDPNENDGDASWPPDNADGVLDAGWSAIVGCGGAFGGVTPAGELRLDLKNDAATAVAAAVGCETTVAENILKQVTDGVVTKMSDFIRTPLSQMGQQNQQGGQQGGQQGNRNTGANNTGNNRGNTGNNGRTNNNSRTSQQQGDLTREQLAALLDTCGIGAAKLIYPGKININTVDSKALEYLAAVTPTVRDAILLFRDQNSGDIASITDLLDVPTLNAATVADLSERFDVRSNVFEVSAQGRDNATGATVEIRAQVDRSTLPVTIRNLVVK